MYQPDFLKTNLSLQQMRSERAGGGDIDAGAEVMENVMKNLEAGGKVSEESQGREGAQDMFEVSERLSEVV